MSKRIFHIKFDSNCPYILTTILTTIIPILVGFKRSETVIFTFFKIKKARKYAIFKAFLEWTWGESNPCPKTNSLPFYECSLQFDIPSTNLP